MKRYLLILFMLNISQIYAQTVGGVQAGGVDVNPGPGGVVQEIKMGPPATIGNTYLNDSWSIGSLYFYGGATIKDKALRYDLKNGMIEINYDGNIRAVKEQWIMQMTWLNAKSGIIETFTNGKEININGTELVGMYRLLDLKGAYSILIRYAIKETSGGYVHALDAGQNEVRISVKDYPYLYYKGEAIEIPKKKKDFLLIFGEENSPMVKEIIKNETLNTKKLEDIIIIVKAVNDSIR